MDKYYSIDDVAKMTGLTTRTLRNYLNDGHIHGQKIDGKWRFSIKDFEAILKNPFVFSSIKSKNNAVVFDFLKDAKKTKDRTCMIIDKFVCSKEATVFTENIISKISKISDVTVKFVRKESHVRIIIEGDDDKVKMLYLELTD